MTKNLNFSRLIHGHWRLREWNLSNRELLTLTQQNIDLGISTFDHADIYGDYSCEKLFGDALSLKKELRKDIQIVTKCGICLPSDVFPKRTMKYYNYSYQHIVSSIERSLVNFRTDYIDVLLLHRPSPFFNPEEVALAFSHLKKSGKVRHFGVSNFNSRQFEMLGGYVDEPLITNQIEASPFCLEHFENGNIDYFLSKKINPMIWSPLAGGKMFIPQMEAEQHIANTLLNVAEELNVDSIDKISYAWLLKHPVGMMPIIGSGKIERIKNAVEALDIKMNLEQWTKIYVAAYGEDLP